MNILIKLMSIVSLVIAPTLAQLSGSTEAHAQAGKKTPSVETIVKQEKATVLQENTVQYK